MASKRYTPRHLHLCGVSRATPRRPYQRSRGHATRSTLPFRSPATLTAVVALVAVAFAALSPALALGWTPRTQQVSAWESAHLAQPDLIHQLIKRKSAYLAGVVQPFDDTDAARHRKHPDGGG